MVHYREYSSLCTCMNQKIWLPSFCFFPFQFSFCVKGMCWRSPTKIKIIQFPLLHRKVIEFSFFRLAPCSFCHFFFISRDCTWEVLMNTVTLLSPIEKIMFSILSFHRPAVCSFSTFISCLIILSCLFTLLYIGNHWWHDQRAEPEQLVYYRE